VSQSGAGGEEAQVGVSDADPESPPAAGGVGDGDKLPSQTKRGTLPRPTSTRATQKVARPWHWDRRGRKRPAWCGNDRDRLTPRLRSVSLPIGLAYGSGSVACETTERSLHEGSLKKSGRTVADGPSRLDGAQGNSSGSPGAAFEGRRSSIWSSTLDLMGAPTRVCGTSDSSFRPSRRVLHRTECVLGRA
jgi:hypothetical protein